MKVFRLFSYILALFVLLCALAVVCLYVFLNPERLKPIIIEQVKNQTGYQLNIDGSLSWTIYPRTAVKVEHMTLTAPGQAAAFLDLRGVKIAAQLAELLHGREKLQGRVDISAVKLGRLQAAQVSGNLRWENQVLTVDALQASMYQGSLKGVVTGRDLFGTPAWSWDAQLNGVQLKPLLADLNGPGRRLQLAGTGQIKMQATTEGRVREQILNHLSGHCEFSVRDGEVEGINLNYFVDAANALINSQSLPQASGMRATSFDSLTGTIQITNGVATSNDMLLTSPAFTVNGQGKVILTSQAVNLQLSVKPKQAVKFAWEIPILVSGNLMHPDVRLDSGAIKKILASEQIKKLKVKAIDKIKEKIPGKAGEFLQNLLR